MHLDGPTLGKLRTAMQSAFRLSELEQMLLEQLNVELEDISTRPNRQTIVGDVLGYYNRRDQIHILVAAARRSNPTNLELRGFQEQYILGASLPGNASDYETLYENFQLMVSAIDMVDSATWRSKLAELESRVCQVILPNGAGTGTGFLVGPDLVMTNYHVVEPLLNKLDQLHTLILRFDYALLSDGGPNAGVDYLAADLTASSPYSEADADPTGVQLAEADKLDFALLRVVGSPGKDRPGGAANKGSNSRIEPRGWIKAPTIPPDLKKPTAIFILQHPGGQPLKLGLATSDKIALNEKGTRVRYRTNTLPGSSGAPCFNHNWELVALHHLGDPAYKGFGLAAYNQGIPFTAITDLLDKNGKLGLLGK